MRAAIFFPSFRSAQFRFRNAAGSRKQQDRARGCWKAKSKRYERAKNPRPCRRIWRFAPMGWWRWIAFFGRLKLDPLPIGRAMWERNGRDVGDVPSPTNPTGDARARARAGPALARRIQAAKAKQRISRESSSRSLRPVGRQLASSAAASRSGHVNLVARFWQSLFAWRGIGVSGQDGGVHA